MSHKVPLKFQVNFEGTLKVFMTKSANATAKARVTLSGLGWKLSQHVDVGGVITVEDVSIDWREIGRL